MKFICNIVFFMNSLSGMIRQAAVSRAQGKQKINMRIQRM